MLIKTFSESFVHFPSATRLLGADEPADEPSENGAQKLLVFSETPELGLLKSMFHGEDR